MNLTRGCGVVLTIGLLLVPSACGKDEVDAAKQKVADTIPRASTSQVTDALVSAGKEAFGAKKKFTRAEARCVADLVEGSGLSNKALHQFVTDPNGFNPTGKDAETVEKLFGPIKACLAKK